MGEVPGCFEIAPLEAEEVAKGAEAYAPGNATLEDGAGAFGGHEVVGDGAEEEAEYPADRTEGTTVDGFVYGPFAIGGEISDL